MTETEARKAFTTANTELQTALSKYQSARASLHRITGEFVGTDQKLSLQFSSACTGLQSEDAVDTHQSPTLTDC